MATIKRLELPGVPPNWDAAQVADQTADANAAELGKAALRRVFPAAVEQVTRLAMNGKDEKIKLAAAMKLVDLAVALKAIPTEPDALESFLRTVNVDGPSAYTPDAPEYVPEYVPAPAE
jgi:hypothetical protein